MLRLAALARLQPASASAWFGLAAEADTIASLVAGHSRAYSSGVDVKARVPSALQLYVKEKFAVERGRHPAGTKVTEILPALSRQYAALDRASKAPYEKKAAQLKETIEAARREAKRPPGPYALFFQEKYGQMAVKKQGGKPDVPGTGRVIGAAWKALSDAQKQSYKDRAAEMQRKYQQAHGGSSLSSASD